MKPWTEEAPANPRVAVVVPVKDAGAKLEAALVSVGDALREGEGVELVVVDDGSKDALTLDLLDRLESEGLRVLRQENRGVAKARMLGVFDTRAPYLFALDADDVLLEGALSDLADALDEHAQAALSWGDLYIELEGKDAKSFWRPSAPSLDPWLLHYVNAVPAGSLLRRTNLLEVGGWQEEVGYADWDLWLRLAEHGSAGVHLERPVYRYHVSEAGLFQSTRHRYGERLQATMTDKRWLTENLSAWRDLSPAPESLKRAYAVLERLPLSPYRRYRLARALFHLLYVGTPECARYYAFRG